MSESVTQLLQRGRAGDALASDRAYALIHEQLHLAAHRQLRGRRGQTLCTTALVNETWLKLAHAQLDIRDREHFLALATRAMRQITVDAARRALADKRGGGGVRITLTGSVAQAEAASEDVIALDEALQQLAQVDPRLAQVVEWRYFGGMSEPEIAQRLGLTERTVRRDWRKARAFLYYQMTRETCADESP